MIRRERTRRRGLALLELLIVIVILTILMVAVMPSYVVARSRGRLTACISNVRNLATAIELYQSEQHALPASLSELVPRFMPRLPTCPSSGTAQVYQAGYTCTTGSQATYTLACSGSFHQDLHLPSGQPAFVQGAGLRCGTPTP